MPRTTLSSVFDARNNSLNALRFVLASGVLVYHSWTLTGRANEPGYAGASLGNWCVLAFFLISGFLVTRSRMRRDTAQYYWDRFLRIVPAFATVLFLIAFVFAPLSTLFNNASYHLSSGISFFLRNLLTMYAPIINQPTIESTPPDYFNGSSWSQAWDFALWSLFFEVGCYIAIGVAVSILPRRWLGPAVLSGVGLFTTLVWLTSTHETHWLIALAAPLPLAFLVGAAAFLYADHVPVTPISIGLSIAAIAGLGFTEVGQAFAPIPATILLFWLGSVLPLDGFGRVNDASYGIYIYAWPMQILINEWTEARDIYLSVGADIAVVFSLTVVCAYLSCYLIERPALELRKRAPWHPWKAARRGPTPSTVK